MIDEREPEPKTDKKGETNTYDIVLRYLTARFREQLVRPYVDDPEAVTGHTAGGA